MKRIILAVTFALGLLGLAGGANACNNPNPNILAGDGVHNFVDDCPLPANSLNRLATAPQLTTLQDQITSNADQITINTDQIAANAAIMEVQIANNTALKALASTTGMQAYRGGFTTAGDGGAARYVQSGSACSLNAGAGDNGSQVKSVDSKCWIADFAPGTTINVKVFGAVCDGTTDDHAAIQSALTAAGVIKGVAVVPAARCNVAGNITIPTNTTLQCINGFTDSEDWTGNSLGVVPALTLSGGSTITAAGTGASINECMIQRTGMTFPAASSAVYAGLAVSDGGFTSFGMSHDIVLGFGTCVFLSGARPYMDRVYMDCAGNAAYGIRGAAFEVDNGNTDAGSFNNIKLQPIATGNADCTHGIRPGGTGISVNGINTFSGFTITQNFGVSQFEVASGTFVVVNGNLWTDYLATCSNTAIGVELTGDLHAAEVDLNGTFYGIVNNYAGSSSFGTVFLNNIGQDCIEAQNGVTKINSLVSNVNATKSCGRYAVNEPGASAAQVLIDTAHISKVNGGATPYFNNVVSLANLPGALYVGHLFAADLTAGSNPYSGFLLAPGSESMVSPISVTLGTKCTGVGSGGSCSVTTGSNETSGIVNIVSGSSGTTATGEVSITFPHAVDNIRTCTFQNYNGAWTNPATFEMVQESTFETGIAWFNGAGAGTNLPISNTYRILYRCSAI